MISHVSTEELMLFLIDYDRRAGKIIEMRIFDDAQGQTARDLRFALELQYHREKKKDREVVLLKADDEKAVRNTHRRYFETLQEFLNLPEFKLQ